MSTAIKVIGYISLAVVQTHGEVGASTQRNKPMIMMLMALIEIFGLNQLNKKIFYLIEKNNQLTF
jgi:hypothetical protein